MADIKLFNSSLNGEVTVCSSKSVAHRAIITGALACRDIKIYNVIYSKDILATIDALKVLGADITYDGSTVIIKKSNILKNSSLTFNANESGSTLRFLIPVFVALGNETKFLGEGRLPKRPLDDYFEIFDKEGIFYERAEDYLPLKTKGTFTGDTFFVKGNVSSQFITGLMLSAIVRDREITIKITTPLQSCPYVYITKKVLEDFGHSVKISDNTITVKKGSKDIDAYTVENDWSQAAFFLSGGVMSGDVTLCDMNLSSAQGDKEIVEILKNMGAKIEINDGKIRAKKSELYGVKIDVSQIPDLVPILSVLGAYAKGETLIYNAARLKIKESDRILSSKKMLESTGVSVETGEDYIKIIGKGTFLNGKIDSFSDHRIVMASAMIGTQTENLIIKNYKAVEKSYPEFFSDYFKLGGKGEVINE